MIPNYKWDLKDMSKFYILLLFKQKNLYTVRELKSFELLERARNVFYKVCSEKFNIEKNELYVFFHYHPTYYSLHLHICNSNFYGLFSNAGKAILLDDVIENLKIDANFYEKRVMNYIERE
ncbi:hypothetical protein GVAV_003119 [Gurleya vavrai]